MPCGQHGLSGPSHVGMESIFTRGGGEGPPWGERGGIRMRARSCLFAGALSWWARYLVGAWLLRVPVTQPQRDRLLGLKHANVLPRGNVAPFYALHGRIELVYAQPHRGCR